MPTEPKILTIKEVEDINEGLTKLNTIQQKTIDNLKDRLRQAQECNTKQEEWLKQKDETINLRDETILNQGLRIEDLVKQRSELTEERDKFKNLQVNYAKAPQDGEVVDPHSVQGKLWILLDDISTALDVYKPHNTGFKALETFVNVVEKHIADSKQLIHSPDGQVMVYGAGKPEWKPGMGYVAGNAVYLIMQIYKNNTTICYRAANLVFNSGSRSISIDGPLADLQRRNHEQLTTAETFEAAKKMMEESNE